MFESISESTYDLLVTSVAEAIFLIPVIFAVAPTDNTGASPSVIRNGTPGAQGIQGIQGPQGEAATIEINATLIGSPPNVVNIGTNTEALFDFTLPWLTEDHSWNLSYFLNDGSRAITGTNINRDVDDSYLRLWGGTDVASSGARITIFGKDSSVTPGYITFTVLNDSGVSVVPFLITDGDAPVLSVGATAKITGIKNIASATDVTNKSYVDSEIDSNIAAAVPHIHSGNNYIVNGGTITHGFGGTPTTVLVTGTNASQCYTVNTVGATTFKVAIIKCSTLANGAADNINWMVM